MAKAGSTEKVVREIRRQTRRRFSAVRLEFPIFSLNPGLRPRGVAPDVWPTLPVRCPPCGRRRAPRSPTSGPITGERDRFGPLAPPVAVWAAFWGRFADVAAAAGSRAVGRRWAWRCAGLVRQACGLPCVQPRLARCPPRAYAVVRRTRRRGGVVRGPAVPAGWGLLPRGVAGACCAREATSWSPASSSSCSLMML